jgi:hypothetical protein
MLLVQKQRRAISEQEVPGADKNGEFRRSRAMRASLRQKSRLYLLNIFNVKIVKLMDSCVQRIHSGF